jgi:hypothetical protein
MKINKFQEVFKILMIHLSIFVRGKSLLQFYGNAYFDK